MTSGPSASPSLRLSRLIGTLILAVLIAAAISAAGREHRVGGAGVPESPPAPEQRPPPPAASNAERPGKDRRQCLETRLLDDARRFAAHRSSSVAFAFLDECGRLVGRHRYRVYSSASVVKVMMLVAYLRGAPDRGLDGAERELLADMIEQSDNRSADTVFATVGETGLDEVAAAAGMHEFESSPTWGSSGITAADQASLLGGLERYVPKRHEEFALGLLANVISEQRWGIPEVKPRRWGIHFKGGWYPVDGVGWRVHQVATLRRGSRSYALAVLSEGNPSFAYGKATIRGVAERLMEASTRAERGAAPGRAARRASAASAPSPPR